MELTPRRFAAALVGVLLLGVVVIAIVFASGNARRPATSPSPGASQEASASVSPNTTASPASPSAAPSTSASTGGTPACSAAQLAFAVGTSGAAGGADHVLLRITNGAAPTCRLSGYFKVDFLTGSTVIDVSDNDSPGLVASTPPAQPITLTPGITAGFILSWQQGPVDPGGRSCPVADTLRLTAPGASGPGIVGARTKDGVQISPCGHSVQVGPVTQGPFPGY